MHGIDNNRQNQQADISDEDLMQRLRAGDKQAFTELMFRYRRKAVNLAYRYIGDFDEAEDLTQDAFAKIYLNADHFDPHQSFSGWFYSILINGCRDKYRQTKRWLLFSKKYGLNKKEEAAYSNPDSSENIEILKSAMARMSPAKREVLALRLAEDLSYEQIAAVLGISVGTVMSRLFRAKKELVKILRQMGAL